MSIIIEINRRFIFTTGVANLLIVLLQKSHAGTQQTPYASKNRPNPLRSPTRNAHVTNKCLQQLLVKYRHLHKHQPKLLPLRSPTVQQNQNQSRYLCFDPKSGSTSRSTPPSHQRWGCGWHWGSWLAASSSCHRRRRLRPHGSGTPCRRWPSQPAQLR